jgi:hypothetical protein
VMMIIISTEHRKRTPQCEMADVTNWGRSALLTHESTRKWVCLTLSFNLSASVKVLMKR